VPSRARLRSLGAQVSSSISSRTSRLIAGGGAGAKLERARRLDIPVLDEASFLAWLDHHEGG